MNLDSAIPMNWKEAVPEDEITKFKEETGNEYGVQIDSIPEFKPYGKMGKKWVPLLHPSLMECG